MRNILITGLASVISFATGLGFEVSGYENIYLAYGLWSFSGILAIVAFCLWFIPKQRKRKKDEYTRVFEIEVPDGLQEKVLGKPIVKGRKLPIKGKYVKRKIEKE